MSFSFKKFVSIVDADEVTEEQITELFGAFSNSKKSTAQQRSDEFKARRDAIKKKQQAGAKPKASDKEPEEKPVSGAAKGRAAGKAAEHEWLSSMND